MKQINAIVLAAMPEEMAPMRKILADYTFTTIDSPIGDVELAHKGRSSLLLIRSGIGLTQTAAVLGWALASYEPRAIVSIGSTGGLSADARVGQVIVGEDYINGGADGTAFGYVRGQVPGQPASFPGGAALLAAARRISERNARSEELAAPGGVGKSMPKRPVVRIGRMLSSDSFITEANVGDVREVFPTALSSDMESLAAAQVAHSFGIPFVSVRGISDLCGAPDDQTVSFHTELGPVAEASATTAFDILIRSDVLDALRYPSGPTQRFSPCALQAALYLVLARIKKADDGDVASLPCDVRGELENLMPDSEPDVVDTVLGQIAAGRAISEAEPEISLSARQYDVERAALLEQHGLASGRGTIEWPPTSQTLIKRFNGFWNDALVAAGITPRRGRARGGIKFTDTDYLYALRSYLANSQHTGSSASFKGYTDWLKVTGQVGRLPSGAAVRQRFGSWREAIAAGEA